MWWKEYQDYPIDRPLINKQVETGKGIIGCEMHDLNGWGTTLHIPKKKKKGLFSQLLAHIFTKKKRDVSS